MEIDKIHKNLELFIDTYNSKILIENVNISRVHLSLDDNSINLNIDYHDVQYALENNINIIDLGHYESEVIVLESLLEFLKSKNINLKISIYNNNIFKRNIF